MNLWGLRTNLAGESRTECRGTNGERASLMPDKASPHQQRVEQVLRRGSCPRFGWFDSSTRYHAPGGPTANRKRGGSPFSTYSSGKNVDTSQERPGGHRGPFY